MYVTQWVQLAYWMVPCQLRLYSLTRHSAQLPINLRLVWLMLLCIVTVVVIVVSEHFYSAPLYDEPITDVMVTCEIQLFQPSSTSDRNNFTSAHRNSPKIISEAYCSSEYFPTCSSEAEIISAAEINFISVSGVVMCEIKLLWNNFKIIWK